MSILPRLGPLEAGSSLSGAGGGPQEKPRALAEVAYMLRQDDNIAKTWTIGGRIKFILAGAGPQEKPKTIDSLSQLKLVPGWDEARIEKLVLDKWQ